MTVATPTSWRWRTMPHQIDAVRWGLPIDYVSGMQVPGLISPTKHDNLLWNLSEYA